MQRRQHQRHVADAAQHQCQQQRDGEQREDAGAAERADDGGGRFLDRDRRAGGVRRDLPHGGDEPAQHVVVAGVALGIDLDAQRGHPAVIQSRFSSGGSVSRVTGAAESARRISSRRASSPPTRLLRSVGRASAPRSTACCQHRRQMRDRRQ